MTGAGNERRNINKNTKRKQERDRQEEFRETRSDQSATHNYHRREVINGSPTDSISHYPYTVSLLNRNSRDQRWHTCGGTLIAPNIGKS